MLKQKFLLEFLLIACLVSTGIHYTDNYLYIAQYPEPAWISPASIYISWGIFTAIALIGYWLFCNQKFKLAYVCLAIYSLCGLSSLAHYFYGAMSEFSLKMHFFILTDGLTGLAILVFTMWSSFITKEQLLESPETKL